MAGEDAKVNNPKSRLFGIIQPTGQRGRAWECSKERGHHSSLVSSVARETYE